MIDAAQLRLVAAESRIARSLAGVLGALNGDVVGRSWTQLVPASERSGAEVWRMQCWHRAPV
jgi:hypothetical protein